MKLKINNDLKVFNFFHWRILNNNNKNNDIDQIRAIYKNNALSINDFKKLEKRYNKH